MATATAPKSVYEQITEAEPRMAPLLAAHDEPDIRAAIDALSADDAGRDALAGFLADVSAMTNPDMLDSWRGRKLREEYGR
jgi:hypothetical protein